MDIPILKYPLLLEIENHFHLIYGQSYEPIEGDVPWKEIQLPNKDEIYYKFNDKERKISNKIKCLSNYNGVWVSNTKKIFIHFNPKKYVFTFKSYGKNAPMELKNPSRISVEGLLNGSIPKFTIKTLSCELNEHVLDLKKKEKDKIINKILDYYKNRNFSNYSQRVYPYEHLPTWIQFQPVSDFIAHNYFDLTEHKIKKKIKLIDILSNVKDEQLYFSPYMTLKDELLHCNTIYTTLKKKIVQFILYKDVLTKLKRFVKQVMYNYQDNIVPKEGLLDLISWKSLQLGLNESKLIFNYQQLTSLKDKICEGTYVFFKSGRAIGIIHCLGFKQWIPLKRSITTTLDLSKWELYNNLYIVSKTHYQKIGLLNESNMFIKLDKNFYKNKSFYLVQIKQYLNDIIKVNTKHFPFIKGSVRFNCLTTFYFKE
jgi:hypothetical protein